MKRRKNCDPWTWDALWLLALCCYPPPWFYAWCEVVDPDLHHRQRTTERLPEQRPRSFDPIDALMRTTPGQEPEISQMELLAVRELIANAIDELEDINRWIIDATLVERVPLRTLERQLGIPKTTLARWRDKALLRLHERLELQPLLRTHLQLDEPTSNEP